MKVLLAVAFVLTAVSAGAQTADTRWEPFLGCWDLTADNVRDDAPAAARLADRPLVTRSRTATGPRVCVTRTPEGGARFETTVRGQAAVDHTVIADGTERALTDAECRGTQRAEFSSDGLRLFSRAELTCQGDPGPRRVSGISLLALNGTWLDIQAVDIDGRETVRVRRYYRGEGQPATDRAAVAASPLSLEDIKEASAKLAPRALEATLVETNAGFYLTGKQLIDLDDAGVPDSVIDLIVALSYPERFVVERTARGGGGGGTTYVNDPFMLGWAFGYPAWYDDFYYSPYYYSPFAYSRYGYRGYYDSPYGNAIVVTPVNPEPQPTGSARAVDGLGYTRIRARETAPADSDSGSRTSVVSSGGSSSTSSGSSSGTASSGGGYSSGGGGGDGGRTAQPR